jgi:hypothetical protein
MTERLLNGVETKTELSWCEVCQAEFESMKEMLRLAKRGLETAKPATEEWINYGSSLKRKLAEMSYTAVSPSPVVHDSWLKRFLTASIRIPLPAGVALLLLFAIPLGLALRRSPQPTVVEKVSTVQVPVEVPVIQEKVVTRIVYRQANNQNVSRRSVMKPDNSAVARSQSSPVNLSEFKPLDEVKFKIIKGGSPDEK